MATKAGDAFVDLGVRDREYRRKMGRAQRGLSGFGKTIRKVGIALGVAFGGAVVLRGLKNLIALSSDATETASKFATVFSSIGDEAENIADSFAKNFGLASSTARKLLGDTGDLLVGFGFTEKQALDLAKQMNELSVDLASFTNIEGGAARASKALTRLLVGETEPAKALGIVVRQDTQEYKELVQELMRAQGFTLLQAKATAALRIAMKQSTKAQGDFARTSRQVANMARILSERWKDLKENVGAAVIDLLDVQGALGGTTGFVEKLAVKFKELRDTGTFIVLSEQARAFFKILGIGFTQINRLALLVIKPLEKVFEDLALVLRFAMIALGDFLRKGGAGEEIARIMKEMDENIRRRLAGGVVGAAVPGAPGGAADRAKKGKAAQFVGFREAIKKAQEVDKGLTVQKAVLKENKKQTKEAVKQTKGIDKLIELQGRLAVVGA